ncbi:MAG: FAD-dependent oxidoreductase, partial [Nitrospinota bacterium]
MDSSSQKSWRCSVCGYVHIGNHPPDFCPVCGVGASEFEAMVPEKPIAREKASDMWRCTICGFIHNGDQPPASCPVCAATSTLFAPVLPEKGADEMLPEEREKIVIVGAGIAGLTAAETIREVSPDADIHLISNEDCLPYYRLNLTRFLAGETDQENLTIHPEEWYAEKRISLIHDQATSIDSTGKRVLLSQKGELPYDKLIITMGAHPFRPSYPGGELSGILTLRTLNDAKDILKLSKNLDGCLCVGGGVLGIETAGALARRGVQVTLLEGHDWLMPRQLNRSAGNLLKKSLEKIGVQVKTNVRIARFLGEENVSGAELTDGTRISTKLAVIT